MTADGGPRRIAILGGGIASLTTAWRLSSEPGIEVTVYQRGWRLGGKGASSRGECGRIEEHGLHIWLGYYDNAFRLMRECYAELDREHTNPRSPIRTWRDAFSPAEYVGLLTHRAGVWDEWMAYFSQNDDLPGEPGAIGSSANPLAYVMRAQQLVREYVKSVAPDAGSRGAVTLTASPTPPHEGPSLVDLVQRTFDAIAAIALELTHLSISGTQSLREQPSVAAALGLLATLRARLAALVGGDPTRRRLFELLDVVVTNLRGVLADGLLIDPRGFSAINGEEYTDWLQRHGASTESLESPLVRGMYDLVFGYREGDPELPQFAAGTALFLSSKIFFDYKGSMFWKMQAGMGDTVFAPLYETMLARGVHFEFFHSVDDLVPDGATIESVRLTRQARLRPDVGAYDPLTDVGGLPCFPASPDAAQLASEPDRADLLETLWATDDAGSVELRRGADYDDLVFGISVGMVPHACSSILEHNERWRAMVRHVGTTATQAFQLWMHDDEVSLGWSQPGSTVTGFVKPFDTTASMSHLLGAEHWPASDQPKSIIYFCSTLDEGAAPDSDCTHYPREQDDRVAASAVEHLEQHAAALLPGAYTPNGFDWDELVDPQHREGVSRFESQFHTANVDPSDRYVQSLPGSERFRLRPDDSGYDNLTLAGDWTDCGLNAGCIEAAVISGIQAANSLLGRDRWDGVSGNWARLEGTS